MIGLEPFIEARACGKSANLEATAGEVETYVQLP